MATFNRTEVPWLLYVLLLAKECHATGIYTDEQYKEILKTHIAINAEKEALSRDEGSA